MARRTANIEDSGFWICDFGFESCGVRCSIQNPKSKIQNAKRAFTLAESLIASVVLAAAVIGISSTVGVSYKQTRVLQTTSSAGALAEQLLEEISAKPWNDPDSGTATAADRETGGRSQYDNIYDYSGFADVSSGLNTLGGDTVSTGGGELYSRSVKVEVLSSPNGALSSSGSFARITVTVTAPGGDRVALSKTVCRTNVVK